MNNLNIDSAVSLSDLMEGVDFMTSGYASIECTVAETTASFEINPDYAWGRNDIKELIQFLKAVRKLLPKDDEE